MRCRGAAAGLRLELGQEPVLLAGVHQRRLAEVAPETTVIMITAHGTIETAVEALKGGAFDYITSPSTRTS